MNCNLYKNVGWSPLADRRGKHSILFVYKALRCKPMTATRYDSITLSGRVVACGNSIFKLSETTTNNLIGRCREKSLLICIGFNIFQLLSVVSPKTVVYITMDWLPLKCMGLEYRVARNGVMGLHC